MREIAIEVDVHVGGALVHRVQLPARAIALGGPGAQIPLPDGADGARFSLRFDGEEIVFTPSAGEVRWGEHVLRRRAALGHRGSLTAGGAAIFFRLIEGGGELRLWPEPVVLHGLRVGATSRFYGTRLLFGRAPDGELRMWDGHRALPPRLGPDLEELRRLGGGRVPDEIASYVARELGALFTAAPAGARISFALSRARLDWSGAVFDLAFPRPGLFTPPSPVPAPREPPFLLPPGAPVSELTLEIQRALTGERPGPFGAPPVEPEEAADFVQALFPEEHRRDQAALDALEPLPPP